MRFLTCITLACCTVAGSVNGADVQLVSSPNLAKPARHGIGKLREAITGRGLEVETLVRVEDATSPYVVVAGLSDDQALAARFAAAGLVLPEQPESLAVLKLQGGARSTVFLCGADAVGLMYAALDTADRIRWATDTRQPFAQVRNVSESARLVDRSVSTYTMQRRWFEQRLHDPSYWEKYFDLLAASRINSYVIVFGYECGGFMAPLYPFFFDVDGVSSGVKLVGITKEQQIRNTKSPRTRDPARSPTRNPHNARDLGPHLSRRCPGRRNRRRFGARWSARAGIWSTESPARIWPPTRKAALKKLLNVFPDIDGIQFRMHWESGLTREETPRFWRDVFAALRELSPDIRFDLRAKGLPDEVIKGAIEQGPAVPHHHEVLDGAARSAVPPDSHQSPEPAGPSPRVRRPAALSETLRHALARVERRYGALSPVGRSGVRPAIRRERRGLRWR